MAGGLARARADLEAGRAWKARDRLTGVLSHRQDDEVLDLLAEAYYRAGDLPAAGVLWWLTGREDDGARVAVAAWQERYGNAEARWHSIPAPVRRLAESDELGDRKGVAQRVDELRSALRSHQGDPRQADRRMRWTERVACAAVLTFLLSIVALLAIGAWTVVQWLLR